MSGERIRTLDEIVADLEEVAKNFDNGWRAEPPTMAALVRRIIRELDAATREGRHALER